jgi:hypothetical protein
LYYPFDENITDEKLSRVIKIAINDLLNLESIVKK